MSSTATPVLQITLNGAPTQVGACTVAALVSDLKLDTKRVAVERNLAIVPRSHYADTPILNGDRIEIVGFIGGG
jgi:thiamine biosynthesis protein ThiS